MRDKIVTTQPFRPPAPAGASKLQPFDASILAGQLAPSSMAMYERDFRAYLAYAGPLEQALQAATLARWRAHLAQETAKSPNTINRMLSAVKRLVREAAVQGYIPAELAAEFEQISGVKAAALKDRTKSNARVRIEPAQMRQLCETPPRDTLIGLRNVALLATLASSGLRVSELTTLTRQQVQRKEGGYILRVRGKNDVAYREAPVSREAVAHMEVWLGVRPVESDYIFTAFDGRGPRMTDRPLSPVAVWKIVRTYSLEQELENIKPHDFRRFVGTQLARDDIRQAQKALGHTRIETTAKHYVLDELEVGLTDDLY
ncbi:MAG: tyrosine-type recombinase/integrase [Caldilineaceae bacterium]|nr:tyrosine-type recombinase/integrase [Caldilineaceae bacterium]